MTSSIVIAASAAARLEPAPISPRHILDGAPQARSKSLAKSYDGTAHIMVWECTEGIFAWHYDEDETVVVVDGEVFITDGSGEERRLGPGDMGFFPAGSSCRWRVTRRIKKIAILRKDLPLALGFGVRVWHKLLRMAHVRGRSTPLSAVVP